jgi:hypothetical protein
VTFSLVAITSSRTKRSMTLCGIRCIVKLENRRQRSGDDGETGQFDVKDYPKISTCTTVCSSMRRPPPATRTSSTFPTNATRCLRWIGTVRIERVSNALETPQIRLWQLCCVIGNAVARVLWRSEKGRAVRFVGHWVQDFPAALLVAIRI